MGVFELAVVAGLVALALAFFLRARRRGDDDALARQLGEPGGLWRVCGGGRQAGGSTTRVGQKNS